MPKDIDEQHDPLDQYAEENTLEKEEIEQVEQTQEKRAPEEIAVNIDTEIAQEATAQTENGVTEDAETQEIEKEFNEAADQALEEEPERKHKNRESTSEKAKRAAAEREAKGESAEPVNRRQLDPLRLRGKKYREAVKGLDRTQAYAAAEAIELVRKAAYAGFDASVDLHVKVKADAVRGTITLPNGNGKAKKVAVATDETIEAISNGKLDFEVLLATPAQMPKLAKFAKVLGPKGLMPSPKSGTVTDDVDRVKEEISKGRIEYRADKTGVVHVSIGRLSFDDKKLLENLEAMKGVLVPFKIKSISLAATMSPAVKVKVD